jgi:hypothetical protein
MGILEDPSARFAGYIRVGGCRLESVSTLRAGTCSSGRDVSENHAGVAKSPRAALSMLAAWGCHSTDATDALDASGVDWQSMHDAELLIERR